MKIHVLAQDERREARFRQANQHLSAEFKLDARSYLKLISEIIADENEDYALITHDSTFFTKDLIVTLDGLVSILNEEWPNWGICGNTGISAFSFGHQSHSVVRYLFDRSGGPNASEFIVPAQTIDGNAILLNCRALRQSHLDLPDLMGFQAHDVILSIECLVRGLAVLIAPQMACFHSASDNPKAFATAAGSEAVKTYLSSRLSNNIVTTLKGQVNLPIRLGGDRIDIEIAALANAASGREPKKVNILIRSQFRHPEMLLRTLQTSKAFAVAARPHALVKTLVVTDVIAKIPPFVDAWADKIVSIEPYDAVDSRSLLIRDGLMSDTSDFTWIVDDDDWLFPNEANRLALVLAVSPPSSIVFVDSRHFIESFARTGSIMSFGYSVEENRHFPAKAWSGGLDGSNQIPICGMIIATDVLRTTPERVFTHLEYSEDYALQLFALQRTRFPPIIVDKQYAGISIRDPAGIVPNSVNEKDRTRWDRSLAELSILMTTNQSTSVPIMSLSSATSGSMRPDSLSSSERRAIIILRILLNTSIFVRRPRNAKAYIDAMKRGYHARGFRGALAALASTDLQR